MPFITEELWQNIEQREDTESLMMQLNVEQKPYDKKVIDDFENSMAVIVNIRSLRQAKGISPKETLDLYIKKPYNNPTNIIIKRMANLSNVKLVETLDNNTSGSSFLVGTTEFFLPLGDLVNVADELIKIEAEIKHLEGFLKGVNAKLSNEKFVANAPEKVLELEKKKQTDALTKLDNLRQTKCKLTKA